MTELSVRQQAANAPILIENVRRARNATWAILRHKDTPDRVARSIVSILQAESDMRIIPFDVWFAPC